MAGNHPPRRDTAPPAGRSAPDGGDGGGAEALVVMAEIGGPHGVRGAVKLTVFAEDPLSLRRYNPFQDAAGETFKLTALKPVGKAITAQIDGVTDRDTAARLRGTRLHVPRARLPRPAEDEFYYIDLVGLEARLANGTPIGHVRGVADFGAGDVLDITGNIMVPFTREVVPTVDVAGGFLIIDPPAGLLEKAEPEEGEDGA